MALFGVMGEFKPEKDPWSADKVATLLSVMGATTYGLLRNLAQPNKPKDKTFEEIVTVLKGHFEPKPLLVAERFHFNRCTQKANQPVAQYVVELKQCAANCEFGANLDASLRDWFVSGMQNEACQRRLLSKNDLTFAKACDNMETADREQRQLRGMKSETDTSKGMLFQGKCRAHTIKRNWSAKEKHKICDS
uniref:Retrotransposon gag domain-containing protein n=1 Tax=Takifugu rubripes TaxID=31033 RepID=A0A674N093_TAKRU